MASTSTPIRVPVPRQGVRADLDPRDVPSDALVDSQNWLMRRGQFQVRPGFALFGTSVGQRPTGFIRYTYHNLSTKIVMGTVAGWWRFNSGTTDWIDITDSGNVLTASATQLQIFRTFSKSGATWLLGVNGKDAPKKWDGATANYADMGGTPPIARTMMVLAERVLLGNLSSGSTISPVAYTASALQDFDSGWGTVQVGLRAESPGPIVAMQEMGFLTGAIYKEDSIDLAIAQADVTPFRFEVRAPNIHGPVSSRAVVALSEGVHAYLGTDGAVYIFDGSPSPKSLGPQVQRAIADSADLSKLGRAWLEWDSDEQILYVFFPARGQTDPGRAVAITFPGANPFPLTSGSLAPTAGAKMFVPVGITIGEFVGTIGDQTLTLGEYDVETPRFLIANVTGQVYNDSDLDDNGEAIASYFEPGLTDLGARGAWKTIQEIDHRFQPTPVSQIVTVRAGVSDYGEAVAFDSGAVQTAGSGGGYYGLGLFFPGGPVTISDENGLDLVTGGPYVSGHRLTGRDLAMRIECEAHQRVIWAGAEATVATRGRR